MHLTEIVNGQMKKIDLCEECAKDKGVTDPQGFALADLLLGLGASSEMESVSAELECPTCGFTQADFKKTGRLGCSTCYTVFGEPLEGMLKQKMIPLLFMSSPFYLLPVAIFIKSKFSR